MTSFLGKAIYDVNKSGKASLLSLRPCLVKVDKTIVGLFLLGLGRFGENSFPNLLAESADSREERADWEK